MDEWKKIGENYREYLKAQKESYLLEIRGRYRTFSNKEERNKEKERQFQYDVKRAMDELIRLNSIKLAEFDIEYHEEQKIRKEKDKKAMRELEEYFKEQKRKDSKNV